MSQRVRERPRMTPQEFRKKMLECDASGDTEAAHGEADELMCDLLESMGYGDGVEVYREMNKWYA